KIGPDPRNFNQRVSLGRNDLLIRTFLRVLFFSKINKIVQEEQLVRKKIVTKAQIYRAVASSTAIETGVSVQKIEQQLKQNQAQAKAVGLAR
ncbi:hypothetical protein ACSJLL_07040, partial [Enterobacter kobei]